MGKHRYLTCGALVVCAALSGPVFAGLGKSTTGSGGTTTTTTGSTSGGTAGSSEPVGKASSGSGTTVISGPLPAVPGVDDDGDGMPSTFEVTYSPLNKYDGTDGHEDADNDFITNVVEYLRGVAMGGSLKPNVADTDGDGYVDGDDLNPLNATVNGLELDGTYSGSSKTESIDTTTR